MNYVELCKKAIEAATRAGANEAEALIVSRHSTGVEIERAEIKTCTNIKDNGIAIRAIDNGKIGFAYTNVLAKEEVERTARQAAKASKASPKDKNWRQLPGKQRYTIVEDTYDKRIAESTPEDVVALCQEMMKSATDFDKRVLPAFGGAEVAVEEGICLNSCGVEVEDRGTILAHALATMARSKAQVSPICFEFKASRNYTPEPEWVGSEAAKLAIDSINVGKAEAGDFPILLDPFALQEIITHTLIRSIQGDMVIRGMSILKDRIGKKIAGEDLTMYDDGTIKGGLRSGKSDMEGVPKQKTPIIENGILKGFLYDNYWARLKGRESTGNADRGGGGLQLPPYGTMPSIKPTNITLKPGSATESELIAEVQNGYYVRGVQGAHQSNPETGDFSVVLTPAWRILKGELTHAVKGAMVAGNIYDMIKNITTLGKNTRQLETLTAPKIITSKLKVISK